MQKMKGRDLLSLHDFTPEEVSAFLDLAAELKEKQKVERAPSLPAGKNPGYDFPKVLHPHPGFL